MAKILVIENSIELRDALIDLLELEGYTALWVANDEALAWEKVTTTLPNLILQDLSVLDENRFNLLYRVRHDTQTARIPVIFLMHYLTQAEVARSKELGASGCLLKPFETRELIEMMRRWTSRPVRDFVKLSVPRNLGNYG